MNKLHRVYELLLDYAGGDNKIVTDINIGLVWTLCKANNNIGLAMSPNIATRLLPWSGTLIGKSLGELSNWIIDWESYKSTVAMAAINCSINARQQLVGGTVLNAGNLAVFEYFLPQLIGKKVVIIGRYPHLEKYQEQLDLSVIERQPQGNDYPDSACEYLLPNADWVFITASSITNKTFPRLAQLSSNAKTVLMGPTLPWLAEFKEFGIDYLAGVDITNSSQLLETIAQGGGVRIFDNAVRYRVIDLHEFTQSN
jgi:uncharacterized protein (DUF4213/DUF364 family)